MANPLYARLQQTANRLILKYGQVGKVTRYTAPSGSEGGEPTPDIHAAKILPLTYDIRLIDGTRITTADRQIYISSVGLSIEPRPDDVVTDAKGVEYTIIAGDPNNYDGLTNVVFIVQGRIQ